MRPCGCKTTISAQAVRALTGLIHQATYRSIAVMWMLLEDSIDGDCINDIEQDHTSSASKIYCQHQEHREKALSARRSEAKAYSATM